MISDVLPRKGSVLIVEDDPLALMTMEMLLQRQGFNCYPSVSPLKALEIIEEREIDLVIADLKMPQMSGIRLYREIREKFGKKPFIIVTGAASSFGIELEILRQSGVPVIVKPIHPDEIMSEVARQIKDNA